MAFTYYKYMTEVSLTIKYERQYRVSSIMDIYKFGKAMLNWVILSKGEKHISRCWPDESLTRIACVEVGYTTHRFTAATIVILYNTYKMHNAIQVTFSTTAMTNVLFKNRLLTIIFYVHK